MFKTCGVPAGIAALVCDLLKGFLPVFISFFFVPTSSFLPSLSVSSPVLGHIFPIFFRFKGGKGYRGFFWGFARLILYDSSSVNFTYSSLYFLFSYSGF